MPFVYKRLPGWLLWRTASCENPLIVQLIKLRKGSSFHAGPPYKAIDVRSIKSFRHSTNHHQIYNCAASPYITKIYKKNLKKWLLALEWRAILMIYIKFLTIHYLVNKVALSFAP